MLPRIEGSFLILEPKSLHRFLTCSLCNGYLRNAHTINECLHSFCKVCIYRYFLTKGACPHCDLVLKPYPLSFLRKDVHLQGVVDKIIHSDDSVGKLPGPIPLSEPHIVSAPESIPLVSSIVNASSEDYVIIKLTPNHSVSNEYLMDSLTHPYVKIPKKIFLIKLKKLLAYELNLLPPDQTVDIKYFDRIELSLNNEILPSEQSLDYLLHAYGNNTSYGLELHYNKRTF